MRVGVIGSGMIGSAAARHIAKSGHDVVLIGPGEPENMAGHSGVFASHYDAGRITRRTDPSAFWARVSDESLARYGEILADSGIEFYYPSGILMTAPSGHTAIGSTISVAEGMGVPFQHFKGEALENRFANYTFHEGDEGLFEGDVAGHIDPRALVAAQIKAAEKHGARVLREEAREITEHGNGIRVTTSGNAVEVDQVLMAMGGFADMLAPKALPIRVYSRTIVLAEVDKAEAAKLAGMPPIIRYFADGTNMYMLPPIRYPDGRIYFKIGGDPVDVQLHTIDEIKTWFRSGGDADVTALLERRMREVLQDVNLGAMHTSACVTTYTDHGLAMLERLTDRISVATAGCGKGAKCSDELGRLGAELALGNELPDWARSAD
ncbi:MAG: FAD-dependent oxidoreductase [Pseudomonadota bacterium]